MLLRAGSGAASPQRRPTNLFELRRGDGAPTAGETRAVPRVAGGGVRLDLHVTPRTAATAGTTPRTDVADHCLTMCPMPKPPASRLERRFEALIWKFRLITLIPVIMSLLGSISCFVFGTYAELSVLNSILRGQFTSANSTLLIGKVVGGIDYYLIGIALLIFGYGIYELVISDIDPRQQDQSQGRHNLLNIDSLDALKQKLTKVIIVALIVTAFKVMVSFEVTSITELLQYCAGVLMLAFSAFLIGRSGTR